MANLKHPLLKNIDSGQIIKITRSPFTIGRALTCNYIIENKIVSRTHCSLIETEEGWTLADSSTNGTLVNDRHYKSESSPVLKHNDEISLGFQSYSYRFLLEVEIVPNNQVERLKNEETIGNTTSSNNEIQNSNPTTPSSFDECGISDDLLNDMADNMLNFIENEASCSTQPHPREDNRHENVSSAPHINQGNIFNENLDQPTTSTNIYQVPERSKRTIRSEEPSVHNTIFNHTEIERNDTGAVKSTDDMMTYTWWQKGILNPESEHRKNDIENNLNSQTSSSTSTVVYSLPGDTSSGTSEEINENTETQTYNVNMKQITAQTSNNSLSEGSIIENISTGEPDATPKPKDHLAECIDAVVKKYSEDVTNSTIAAASTSIQNTGIATRISNIGPSTSGTYITVPTSLGLASPVNSNKKIKVMAVSPSIIGQLRPATGQLLSALSVGGGQQSPVIRMINNNQLQMILANQPRLPVVSLGSVTTATASDISRMSNSTVASSLGTGTVRAYRNNRAGTNTNSARRNTNFTSASTLTSTNGGHMALLQGVENLINNPNSNLSASTIRVLKRAVCQSKQQQPDNSHIVDNSMGNSGSGNTSLQNAENNASVRGVFTSNNVFSNATSTVVSGDASLQNAENRGAITGNAATVELVGSNMSIIDSQAVPAAIHEVIIGDNNETAGNSEINIDNRNENQAFVSVKNHDLQGPSTSKASDQLKTDNSGQTNQNQYEEMENELQCTICTNLFIKAVTIGCSHSFCQYCIEEWKKKKTDCPICRKKITSTTRTLVLDNVIDKMLENASEEDKQDRKAAVEERKELEEAEAAKKNQQNINRNGRGRRAGRRGGRGNANRRNDQRGPNEAANNIPLALSTITIVDSPSTTDSEVSDTSDYDREDYYGDEWYNGRTGAYYGGYGRCYNCGEGGHWANGCPYR